MDYILHSNERVKELKSALNIDNIDELLKDIPKEIKLKDQLKLADGMSELEILKFTEKLRKYNNIDYFINLQGAGIYNHFIPAIVDSIASRTEFLTAYTPYQAEISQGLLQSIFEYQTAISRLTGMEVCNASLYDGSTALCEAIKLAVNATGKSKVLVSNKIHPEYIEVLKTFKEPLETLDCVYFKNIEDLENLCSQDVAAIVISSPNFFGEVEDIKFVSDIAHQYEALSIVSVYPISLGILESPGNLGADIVTGEGQPLGMPLALGGATLGLFATKKKYIRLVPGRLVGKTEDQNGNQSFVLTMQAREQHIRREKSLSNICSNHAHYALRALIYLSCMGDNGLKNAAKKSMQNAYYLNAQLRDIGCFEILQHKGFFNEFVVKLKDEYDFDCFNKELKKNGVVFGVKLNRFYKKFDRHWLVCTTEILDKKDIDTLIEIIRRIK